MAEDWRSFALEKAELLSSHLRDLVSSGQGYVRAQFGVDLGLKPELCPTWVVLLTTAAAALLLAAVCGALLGGKKRGSPAVTRGGGEPVKAHFAPNAKPEEQKKRNRKKTTEKKTQSNGQPVTVAQEEVKVTQVVSKSSPKIKTEKVHEVQAPVQVKKNKKKTKTDVKPTKHVPVNEGKEPDEGAWETKVSNREKRQQRRKDKGSEDSGSPGGVEAKARGESPVVTAPANTKKNRGNHENLHLRTTGKGEAAGGSAPSSWREEPSVNGRRWTDISLKVPGQMGTMEGTKWSAIHTNPHYRTQPEPQSWAQENQAAWSGINGQRKTDLSPVSFSMLGLNTTDSASNSIELQWARQPEVVDEWSGFNGAAAVDPSSDWNAPSEHWGNYEEPLVLVTPAPPLKQKPTSKVSDGEKDTEDPTDGAAKSKKKRKKKKKTEEEAASEAQTVSTVPMVNTVPKTQEPVLVSKKQNPSVSSSQKKSEQIVEPPKPSQKKKVRKET